MANLVVRAAGGNASVRALIRFASAADLDAFLAQQTKVRGTLPRGKSSSMEVIRPLRSINAVAVRSRVGALTAMAESSRDALQSIDDDFPVRAFLDDTKRLVAVAMPRQAGLTGEGIVVAVLDTGIDTAHPDLADAVAERADMTGEGPGDGVGHGTHVASIIAGRGVADPARDGIAPRARLLDIKVLGADGSGSASTVIAGIERAVELGADVINMSLGAVGDFDGTDAISAAADWAVDQGAVLCVAAGNCGPDGDPLGCPRLGERTIGSPGCAARVITVGAADKTLAVAGYSSRGPTGGGLAKPDVVTVGSAIVAARAAGTAMGTPVDDAYTRASGTSMATPVCAGLVALYLQSERKRGRAPAPDAVKAAVLAAARGLEGATEPMQGKGFLAADALIVAAAARRVEVGAFAPRGGAKPVAGTRSPWGLTLAAVAAEVFDVEVTFAPAAGVAVDPTTKSFGTLAPGHRETAYVAVLADRPGAVEIPVTVRFKLDPSGEFHEEAASVSAQFAAKTAVAAEQLSSVIEDATARFLSRQNADGTWTGSIMYNSWPAAMWCIAHRILNLPRPAASLQWLESNRLGLGDDGKPDDTWGFIDPPSRHMLETTLVSEIALEIWGYPRNQKTWDFLNRQSLDRLAPAMALADPFTQTFAALANPFRPAGTAPYYAIADIFAPPIETIVSPPLLKLSIPRMVATWAQNPVLGLMIVLTVAKGEGANPLKKALLKLAEAQLLRFQNPNGSWYCTVLPTLAGVMALHALGYTPSDRPMASALAFVASLQRPDGYVERFHLPVWDTGLSVIGLRAAGVPADDPRLRKAGQYLMRAQDPVTGGVPFQVENAPWPDTDDTAIVCLALDRLDMGPDAAAKEAVTRECLRWLLFMQGDDGGWASFQKDQSAYTPGRQPFFQNDPPTPDVTGHVMSALALAGRHGFDAKDAVERGNAWLRRTQLGRGEWFGRWGLTYTYGTTAVLQGWFDLKQAMQTPSAQQAVDYLLSAQRPDGGWGEGFVSYYNLDAADDTPSTVEQSAWSVLGLMTVPETPAIAAAIDRGVAFILDSYDPARGWPEDRYTVGALWIYKNTIYPYAWALWALGLYRQRKGG